MINLSCFEGFDDELGFRGPTTEKLLDRFMSCVFCKSDVILVHPELIQTFQLKKTSFNDVDAEFACLSFLRLFSRFALT